MYWIILFIKPMAIMLMYEFVYILCDVLIKKCGKWMNSLKIFQNNIQFYVIYMIVVYKMYFIYLYLKYIFVYVFIRMQRKHFKDKTNFYRGPVLL